MGRMSRQRLEYRAFARAYLGMERLPAGVPAMLDALAAATPRRTGVDRSIGRYLDRWRKPVWTL